MGTQETAPDHVSMQVEFNEIELSMAGYELHDVRARYKSEHIEYHGHTDALHLSLTGRFDPDAMVCGYSRRYAPALILFVETKAGKRIATKRIDDGKLDLESAHRIRQATKVELGSTKRRRDPAELVVKLRVVDLTNIWWSELTREGGRGKKVKYEAVVSDLPCGCKIVIDEASAETSKENDFASAQLHTFAVGSIRPCNMDSERKEYEASKHDGYGYIYHPIAEVRYEILDAEGFLLTSEELGRARAYLGEELSRGQRPLRWAFAEDVELDTFVGEPARVRLIFEPGQED